VIREQVLDCVRMLASASAQLEYERDVPHAYVPDELVSGFADDVFHPKAPDFISSFADHELRGLSELYGLVCAAARELHAVRCETVADLQRLATWRKVMQFAKDLAAQLERA